MIKNAVDTFAISGEVMEIYGGMTEEERQKVGTQEYSGSYD